MSSTAALVLQGQRGVDEARGAADRKARKLLEGSGLHRAHHLTPGWLYQDLAPFSIMLVPYDKGTLETAVRWKNGPPPYSQRMTSLRCLLRGFLWKRITPASVPKEAARRKVRAAPHSGILPHHCPIPGLHATYLGVNNSVSALEFLLEGLILPDRGSGS